MNRGFFRAYIGLGSNMDDPAAQLRSALAALGALENTFIEAVSSLYLTAPIGHAAQPHFINAACRVRTALAPDKLMRALLNIERGHGRVRRGPRGGPRVLDLDLLLYGGLTRRTPDLQLPHPRMHERAFVLRPLAEIEPALTVPGHGPVSELLAQCAGQDIEKLEHSLENHDSGFGNE